ncbi:MAG TPA: hypothetical protein VGM39_13830 [Kofleriaceae bacterium]
MLAKLANGNGAVIADFEFRPSADHLREIVETRLAMMRNDTAREIARKLNETVSFTGVLAGGGRP